MVLEPPTELPSCAARTSATIASRRSTTVESTRWRGMEQHPGLTPPAGRPDRRRTQRSGRTESGSSRSRGPACRTRAQPTTSCNPGTTDRGGPPRPRSAGKAPMPILDPFWIHRPAPLPACSWVVSDNLVPVREHRHVMVTDEPPETRPEDRGTAGPSAPGPSQRSTSNGEFDAIGVGTDDVAPRHQPTTRPRWRRSSDRRRARS